ncbi:MAG: glycosyltransferase [Thermoplasmata archaeon]|nr:glycosyltransferase [Thermoplasmata archaeon]
MTSTAGSAVVVPSSESLLDSTGSYAPARIRETPSRPVEGEASVERPEYVVPSGISLVIPAYNEEHRLRPTLVSYLPALRSLGVPFEVIVSVSGEDRTWEIVEEFASQGVRGIRSRTRMGKGRAILEGFREAKLPIVALADADGSVPGYEVARLLRMALEKPQVVVASRRLDRSRVEVGEPWTKKLASDVWHAMVKVMLDLPVRDAECGFKVYTRELAQMAVRDIVVTNWVFDLDLMFHAKQYGAVLTEVAVDYKYDMRSKMRLGRAVGPMFLTLWGVFLVNRTNLRRYLPMGLMLRLHHRFAAH